MKRSQSSSSATSVATANKGSSQQQATVDLGINQLKTIVSFRDNFDSSLKEVAKRANIQLLPTETAVAVRGDYVIASLLTAPPKGVSIEESDGLFFVYLSFPKDHVFAKKIPSGYYTIERVPKQVNPMAKVVNLEGKTVLELPLNIRKLELKAPPAWEAPPQKDTLFVQTTIEQSQETLYELTRMQAHKVRCHWSILTWYWIWV